jgi:hypothetical protein
MTRFFTALPACCCLAATLASPTEPAYAASSTAVPEIAALLPSGIYTGHAIQAGRKSSLALNVQESKPGGRFVGTVHIEGNAMCGSPLPMIGEIKTGGVVHIESEPRVAKACERIFSLNLAGSDLKGTMLTTEGTYQVLLKRTGQ